MRILNLLIYVVVSVFAVAGLALIFINPDVLGLQFSSDYLTLRAALLFWVSMAFLFFKFMINYDVDEKIVKTDFSLMSLIAFIAAVSFYVNPMVSDNKVSVDMAMMMFFASIIILILRLVIGLFFKSDNKKVRA
jgi:hypothetical protein